MNSRRMSSTTSTKEKRPCYRRLLSGERSRRSRLPFGRNEDADEERAVRKRKRKLEDFIDDQWRWLKGLFRRCPIFYGLVLAPFALPPESEQSTPTVTVLYDEDAANVLSHAVDNAVLRLNLF